MERDPKRSKLSSAVSTIVDTGVAYDTSEVRDKSYVKRRVQKKQEFLTNMGTKTSENILISRCKVHVGNEYVDPQTSFLSFKVQAQYARETDLTLCIDTHPISLINRVSVFDKFNKELYTIDYLNKCIIQHWGATKCKHFLEDTLGWGKYNLTWINSSSKSTVQECVIPLSMLGGFFETSSPLPPQLMSELIIEIVWERPELALTLYPSQSTFSDQWQGGLVSLEFEDFTDNLILYDFTDLVLITDCWEMDTSLYNQLTEKYNNEGIHIQFKSFTNQTTEVFDESTFSGTNEAIIWSDIQQSNIKLEIPITQSFTRASKVTLFTWPEFNQTPVDDQNFLAASAVTFVAWWSSNFHQLCTSYHQNFDNFITKSRTRLHNYYIPQHEEVNLLVPYTNDPLQVTPNQRWKKKFLDGVSHNTIRSHVETQDENASVNGKQWSKPFVVRLNRTFRDSGIIDAPPDLLSEDSIRIDFEHPVALQLEFRPIFNERNVIYNGWMKYRGATDPPLIAGNDEAQHFRYWNSYKWNGFFIRGLVSIEHNVSMKITPQETLISK